MSDPKRANLITVGVSKSGKKKVNKTVRLTINLDESNESKYPELNYKELVIAEVRRKPVENGNENGKTAGLNPYSDNDEDVERIARKFEQKYGGNSTYGKKKKNDDFADIGAGYDENDPFIDNTDGYDEMVPPECETFYGGFYINSGLLEFKNADQAAVISDCEPGAGRRNKRRISSSSSSSSSESSSESGSGDEVPPLPNGVAIETEHRKKNKKNDNKKPKKVRRTDSSAATSGKQTSDDNGPGEGESDSRTSHSDSLGSKPRSSETAVTSDSSRDTESKAEPKLSLQVCQALEELEAAARALAETSQVSGKELETRCESYLGRLERALISSSSSVAVRRAAFNRASLALRIAPEALASKARAVAEGDGRAPPPQWPTVPPSQARKRPTEEPLGEDVVAAMTEAEREEKIVETLLRLKVLIDERKPGMMATYNAECERVQEERKKMQIAAIDGAPVIEKRLPKRRFPWCPRARGLLARITRLAGGGQAAASLLATRALPLFPVGFVRMPTLLRQADLSKEVKVSEVKRARSGGLPPLAFPDPMQFPEAIQFPSSLTVTATPAIPKPDKEVGLQTEKDKYKNPTSVFGSIINSFTLGKDLVVEKQEDKRKEAVEKVKEDLYIPPNNIGSITITPVPSNQPKTEKKPIVVGEHKEPLLRVKSPAALNEMAQKREKEKALEQIHKKEKDKHKKPEKHHSSDVKHHHSSDKYHNSERHHHSNDKTHHTSEKSYHTSEKSHHTEKSHPMIDKHHQTSDNSYSGDKIHHSVDKHLTDKHHTSDNKHHSSDKYHTSDNKHTSDKHHSSDKHLSSDKYHPTDKHLNDKHLNNVKEKRVSSPLHIDTSYQPKQKEPIPSPKSKADKISHKDIQSMRVAENNIPRPALIPVSHSPTFAKPTKLPEVRKKDILIVSDVDPLGESEPLAIDDSSSDVEVVEDTKSDRPSEKSDSVPSKDKVSVNHKDFAKDSASGKDSKDDKCDNLDDAMKEDFTSLMKNLRDLENSQEQKFSSNSFGGVIASERDTLNKMDGCSAVNG